MKNAPSRGTTFKLVAVSMFVALPFLGAYLYVSSPDRAASSAPVLQEVVHDANAFRDGQAQFFDYQTPDGSKVMYFVVRGRDGVIRAAFDACDECWKEGKGHYQEGDAMVCRNCDKRFPLNSIDEATSDCNPFPLKVTMADGKVKIDPKKLTEGTQYFVQSGGGIGGPRCGGSGCGGCGGDNCGGCGGDKPAQQKGGCC